MRRAHRDYLISAPDDGLPAAMVGPWGAEKYRRVGMYDELFSTGMKNRFHERVYVELFSGSGHATFRDSRRRVLTSPLIALSVPDRFTRYVFCEKKKSLATALETRARATAPNAEIRMVAGDANDRAAEIATLIPRATSQRRGLTFCFVDPFGINIHFDTIQTLATDRAVDFLILLALGVDANRNQDQYLRPEDAHVDAFLGDSTWRERISVARLSGENFIRFLAGEYATRMQRLGYLTTSLSQMIEVRDRHLKLYYLAYFSRHELGYRFWEQVQKYAPAQMDLELG